MSAQDKNLAQTELEDKFPVDEIQLWTTSAMNSVYIHFTTRSQRIGEAAW